jgi:hypothetical protein
VFEFILGFIIGSETKSEPPASGKTALFGFLALLVLVCTSYYYIAENTNNGLLSGAIYSVGGLFLSLFAVLIGCVLALIALALLMSYLIKNEKKILGFLTPKSQRIAAASNARSLTKDDS